MIKAFAAQLKRMASDAGADLIGIASVDRFEEVHYARHPRAIFPETQSVLVLGKRITRGCLRGVEEGSQFAIWKQYANNWVPHRFLAMTTVTVASFLENNRFEAVPLPNLPSETPPMGISVRPGVPPPNVMLDFKDAAVRAGLGEISYSGELMTPQFGHLQRIQLILTDATLEPDPLCEVEVCDRCGLCVRACPLGAFGEEREIDILGKRMRVANIDRRACEVCRNGACANPYHPSGEPDRTAAACMRTCLVHLEEGGRLERRYHNPFRKRPAWQINRSGQASVVEEIK